MAIGRGTSWSSRKFIVKNRRTGAVLSMVGRDIRAGFRDQFGTTVALELTTANGGIIVDSDGGFTFSMNSAQTATMMENSYDFDCIVQDLDRKRIMKGVVHFEGTITP